MKDAALIISTGAAAWLFTDAEAATERAERSNEKRIILLMRDDEMDGWILSWKVLAKNRNMRVKVTRNQ